MNKTDIAVAVYDTHLQAATAVKTLQRAGFEMTKISITGPHCPAEERFFSYFNTSERVSFFGKLGAFRGGLEGAVFAVRPARSLASSGDWDPEGYGAALRKALKANKFLLVVHGDVQELTRAHEVLDDMSLVSFDAHRIPDAPFNSLARGSAQDALATTA
jgi:hypothetical protein